MKKIIVLFLMFVLIVGCNEQNNNAQGQGGQNQESANNDASNNASNNEANNSNEPVIVEITEEWGNKMCPVMQDEAVDKETFVVYEDKKVYLCCDECVEKFQADPKKYHDFLVQSSK
ncbi:hypothetical protein [Candidatus Uabimicrobium amorphum]|uniref:TRASH domain-containing protein n=1 Tax=Uabimicrobium amorphum TaxID=2596890 RepID=A0A5S9INR6_UABAM|nr:hypothetical protein [Candidatus Uabimicrobium amorphum]BBM84910.1 hypothetical protein UABAM_03271 [Candidatus Uabimicrobium amorphum]